MDDHTFLSDALNDIRARLIGLEYKVEKKADHLESKLEESIKDSKTHTEKLTSELQKNITALDETRIRPIELEIAKVKGGATLAATLVSFVMTAAGLLISYFTGFKH